MGGNVLREICIELGIVHHDTIGDHITSTVTLQDIRVVIDDTAEYDYFSRKTIKLQDVMDSFEKYLAKQYGLKAKGGK